VTFSLYWQLLGVTLAIVGLQGVMLGCLARVFFDYSGHRSQRILRTFSYNRLVLAALLVSTLGVACEIPLVIAYFEEGLRLPSQLETANYLAVSGLFFLIAGFTLFIFTLLINAAALSTVRQRTASIG